MEKKIKLIFIGALVVVAIITGVRTWGIVRDEIMPDLKGESAGEQRWNEYTDSWSFDVVPGFDLDIDLFDVDVVLKVHDNATVLAAFSGERKLVSRGSRNELTGEQNAGTVRFYEDSSKSDALGLGSSGTAGGGEFRGVMTVTLPREGIGYLTVHVLSGNVNMQACAVKNLTLESTAGSIVASHLTVEESSKFQTFSGNISLSGLEGANCAVGTTTGATKIENATADSLYLEQYSGQLSLDTVTVKGKTTVTSSTGELTLGRLTARLLEITAANGNIAGEALTVQEAIAQTEAGALQLTFLADCDVTVSTLAGDVNLAFPADMGFRLTVSTEAGPQDIGYTPSKYYTGAAGESEYDCQVGSGDNKVRVATVTGGITIYPWTEQS